LAVKTRRQSSKILCKLRTSRLLRIVAREVSWRLRGWEASAQGMDSAPMDRATARAVLRVSLRLDINLPSGSGDGHHGRLTLPEQNGLAGCRARQKRKLQIDYSPSAQGREAGA